MKKWLRQFSFWLALLTGVALASESAWLEVERRNAHRLTLSWRQRLHQYEEFAKASPARTLQNEQAMVDEILRLQREVMALRMALFPAVDDRADGVKPEGRIGAYFDVAALIVRLRAVAGAADVLVKSNEHFGFAAYAHEAPLDADLARVQEQCVVGETLLKRLFSARPRELLAVKRTPVSVPSLAVDRQQADHFVLDRGLSLRGEDGWETLAFRIEFSGETSALRRFLEAVAHATELLVVRSVDAAPSGGGVAEKVSRKEVATGLVAQPAISRFTVTVEAFRPARTAIAETP